MKRSDSLSQAWQAACDFQATQSTASYLERARKHMQTMSETMAAYIDELKQNTSDVQTRAQTIQVMRELQKIITLALNVEKQINTFQQPTTTSSWFNKGLDLDAARSEIQRVLARIAKTKDSGTKPEHPKQ